MRGVAPLVLQVGLLILASASAGEAAPCYPVGLNADLPRLRRANMVYLRLHEDTFPDTFVNPRNPNEVATGIRAAIKGALNLAAARWNQRCNPAPLLNDQPVLIPTPAGFHPPASVENTYVVDVRYQADFMRPLVQCEYFPEIQCGRGRMQLRSTMIMPT